LGDDGSTESVGVHGNLGWEESNLSGIPGCGGGAVVVSSGGGTNEGGNVSPRLLGLVTSDLSGGPETGSETIVVWGVPVFLVSGGRGHSVPGSLLGVKVVWHNEEWDAGLDGNTVGDFNVIGYSSWQLVVVVFHMMNNPIAVDTLDGTGGWVEHLEGWWTGLTLENVGTLLVWLDVGDVDGLLSSTRSSGTGSVVSQSGQWSSTAAADLWATDQSELLSVVFSITNGL